MGPKRKAIGAAKATKTKVKTRSTKATARAVSSKAKGQASTSKEGSARVEEDQVGPSKAKDPPNTSKDASGKAGSAKDTIQTGPSKSSEKAKPEVKDKNLRGGLATIHMQSILDYCIDGSLNVTTRMLNAMVRW